MANDNSFTLKGNASAVQKMVGDVKEGLKYPAIF
jgi:hypothetical protein